MQASALAQDQHFSKVQINVTKVAGTVYLLEGAGGNIAASVGDDGIVIVDDQYAPMADKIRAALEGVTYSRWRTYILRWTRRRLRQDLAGRHVTAIPVSGWGQSQDKQSESDAEFDAHSTNAGRSGSIGAPARGSLRSSLADALAPSPTSS